jgi:transposase
MGQLKELKDTEAKWLKDCPSQTLQRALKNLEQAYSNFFQGGGFPTSNPNVAGSPSSFPKA